MKYRLVIPALLVVAVACLVFISAPAGGQCDSGIKKEHLDPDAGDFVDGTVKFHLHDGHGSVRHHADSSGTLISYTYGAGQSCDTFAYDAYGHRVDPLKDSINEGLFYTGEQWDNSAEQYYLRARYYDPLTGRFNRIDPFAGNNLDPQSLHKYNYAHNNPVNRIDPSGNFPINLAMVLTTLAVLTVIIALGFRGRASSPRHKSYDLTKACNKYDEEACSAVGEPNYDEKKCRIEAIVLTARYQTGLLRYWETGPWYTQCQKYVLVIRDIFDKTARI